MTSSESARRASDHDSSGFSLPTPNFFDDGEISPAQRLLAEFANDGTSSRTSLFSLGISPMCCTDISAIAGITGGTQSANEEATSSSPLNSGSSSCDIDCLSVRAVGDPNIEQESSFEEPYNHREDASKSRSGEGTRIGKVAKRRVRRVLSMRAVRSSTPISCDCRASDTTCSECSTTAGSTLPMYSPPQIPPSSSAKKLATEEMLRMYRQMVDHSRGTTDAAHSACAAHKENEGHPKVRALAVLTKSNVLNDMQSAPSSDEFVRHQSKLKRSTRKTGNLVLSGISKTERECVHAIARHMGLLRVAPAVDDDTRFVVADASGLRTISVMRAVVAGIPVVPIQWAYRSLEAGTWLSGADFVIPRWKTAFKARRNGRQSSLLTSLGYFYVSPKCTVPAADLAYLIRRSGGKISESLSRASVIVAPVEDVEELCSQRRSSFTEPRCCPDRWILDCITENRII